MSLIYPMLMSVDSYVEDERGTPKSMDCCAVRDSFSGIHAFMVSDT